jgi:signal transduction histidine kinase
MTRRLRDVLARQWIGFGLLLFGGGAAMALLLLFLLEDAFIDQRLREVGTDLAGGMTQLPARFERHARATASPALAQRTAGMRDGIVREFRLDDGRYVHVLATSGDDGTPLLVLHDVSDQLYVNAALARAWPWLLGFGLLLALAATWLARRFVQRVSERATALVGAFAAADAPDRLHALADGEGIDEFAQLARAAAAAWQQRLEALARERETLAFLGHELRTPLQSARTSLALLQDDRDDEAAWRRLQRAQDRLVRASEAILALGAPAVASVGAHCDVAAVTAALATEFAPLAHAHEQEIRIDTVAAAECPMPAAVAESVFANLLLNAIQHGGPGRIDVEIGATGAVMVNPPRPDSDASGFGLGLTLVERLLQRHGARMHREPTGSGEWRVAIQWPCMTPMQERREARP